MDAELAEEIADAKENAAQQCGHYLLLEHLAAGAFGEVHRSWDPRSEEIVAVKVLTSLNPAGRERFKREISASARLEHPHIVTLLDSGVHRHRPYLVMTLIKGDTLRAAAPLEARAAARVMQRVSEATAFAHGKGVLHRDLKPENILLEDDGTPYVADFGLARFTLPEGPTVTATGEMIGSPLYMAPEQSEGIFEESVDIYALGATLYYALTGRPPLKARTLDDYLALLARDHPDPPSAHVGEPSDLDTICLKCLEKDPDQRYGSAQEVGADLSRYLSGEPILAQPPAGATQAARWAQRNTIGLVLGGLALVAGLAALIALALK